MHQLETHSVWQIYALEIDIHRIITLFIVFGLHCKIPLSMFMQICFYTTITIHQIVYPIVMNTVPCDFVHLQKLYLVNW